MKALEIALLLPVVFAACGHNHNDHAHATPPAATPRPVSILVEVYDPITNFVWENVSVRIVEADQEWSNCTCASPYTDWYLTDAAGRVLLDEFVLAAAEVGFLEDGAGGALLGPGIDEDQATVVLEIDAVGFMPIFVEVPLRWDLADVIIEIPFN